MSDNFVRSNKFISNSARYGANYASFPTRLSFEKPNLLKKKGMISIRAYPGVQIDAFNLTIIDAYGQIMYTRNGMYFKH